MDPELRSMVLRAHRLLASSVLEACAAEGADRGASKEASGGQATIAAVAAPLCGGCSSMGGIAEETPTIPSLIRFLSDYQLQELERYAAFVQVSRHQGAAWNFSVGGDGWLAGSWLADRSQLAGQLILWFV